MEELARAMREAPPAAAEPAEPLGLSDYAVVWTSRYLSSSRRLSRWLTDLLPLFLTTLIAYATVYVTTKVAVYDAQPFLTRDSLLAIALAGIVATTVVDALFKAIGWMRGGLGAVLAK